MALTAMQLLRTRKRLQDALETPSMISDREFEMEALKIISHIPHAKRNKTALAVEANDFLQRRGLLLQEIEVDDTNDDAEEAHTANDEERCQGGQVDEQTLIRKLETDNECLEMKGIRYKPPSMS